MECLGVFPEMLDAGETDPQHRAPALDRVTGRPAGRSEHPNLVSAGRGLRHLRGS